MRPAGTVAKEIEIERGKHLIIIFILCFDFTMYIHYLWLTDEFLLKKTIENYRHYKEVSYSYHILGGILSSRVGKATINTSCKDLTGWKLTLAFIYSGIFSRSFLFPYGTIILKLVA